MDFDSIEQKLSKCLSKAIKKGIFPGCVVGVIDRNGNHRCLPYGTLTGEPESPLCGTDTIYDVASITKVVPTSILALQALELGLCSPETRVCAILPEIGGSYREKVCIEHLLTHTLDFGFRLSSYKDYSPENLLAVINSCDLNCPPGETFFYSNATSIILGQVVERLFQGKLDSLGQERIFSALDMVDTTFDTGKLDMDRVAPSEIDPWRGRTIRGEIHDESAFVLQKILTPGSAGLFSTVPDLLNVVEMLLGEGCFRGARVLAPETIQALGVNRIERIGECTAWGWELNQQSYMGDYCTTYAIGKTGFTGCVLVCDLKLGVGFVLLSNWTYPHRKAKKDAINEVRKLVSNIILGQAFLH